MFNNKKNDPLIDSVKAVMEQNELFRQIEQELLEEYGVVSRKALPHEIQPEFDAVLAEAKKCAMEELKGDQHKIDANKNKKIDAHDFKLLRAKKKMGLEEETPADEGRRAAGYKGKTPGEQGEIAAKNDDEKREKKKKNKYEKYKFTQPGDKISGYKEKESPKGSISRSWTVKMDEESEQLDEKAVSEVQQKLMAMALRYKRDPESMQNASSEVKRLAQAMPEKQLRDFAKTSHKGIPERVDEEKLTGGAKAAWQMGEKHGAKGSAKFSDKQLANSFGEYAKHYHRGYESASNNREWREKQQDDRRLREDIDSIMEEIRNNLEEQLVAVYESGDEDAFTDFVESLTEEQAEILGLQERYPQNYTAPNLNNPRAPNYGSTGTFAPRGAPTATPTTSNRGGGAPKQMASPDFVRQQAMRRGAVPPSTSSPAAVAPAAKPAAPAATPAPAAKPAAPRTTGRGGGSGASTDSMRTQRTAPAPASKPAAPRTATRPVTRPARPAAKPAPKRSFGYGAGGGADRSSAMGAFSQSYGSVNEDSDKPQIKESFEHFIRNKFLKD